MTTYSDFRSDTVTRPTEKMRKAMAEAVVGDDVLGDDPTVQRLEALAAETMGKEAALFCPSGTMANSIAVKMWTNALEEVIVEERSHIYNMESTHMTFISGVTPRPVRSNRGVMDPEDVRAADPQAQRPYAPDLPHLPREHPQQLERGGRAPGEFRGHPEGGGRERPQGPSGRGPDLQREPRLGGPGQGLCRACVDSLMFCLSKGLSAPVGSMLVADREHIDYGRRIRKALGGGMRQVGVLAAPGIIALTEMPPQLKEDNARAGRLARAIQGLPGIVIDPASSARTSSSSTSIIPG